MQDQCQPYISLQPTDTKQHRSNQAEVSPIGKECKLLHFPDPNVSPEERNPSETWESTGRPTGGPVSSSGCPISRAQVAREVGSRREVGSKEKSEAKRSGEPSRTEERPQHSASSAALLCVLCVLRFAVSPQSSQTQQDYPHNRRRPSRPRIAQPPPIPNAPENPAPPATGRRRSPRRPFAQ